MILRHVDVEATRPRNLLELALRAGCAAEAVEAADGLEHGGQGDATGVAAEAAVRADAVVQVALEGARRVDGIRVGEDGGVAVGGDLRAEGKRFSRGAERDSMDGGKDEGGEDGCAGLMEGKNLRNC